MVRKKKTDDFTFAVGRRKTSIARIRLYRGRGQTVVNNIALEQYFPGEESRKIWGLPFSTAGADGKYYVSAKIVGGGKRGQLGAFVHGVARAFVALDESYKGALRHAGLLTRDPRARERRKVGTGGKARRKKQSPKR